MWIDKVEKNLVEIGIQNGEIAQDRVKFKQVCVAAMILNGLRRMPKKKNT